MDFSNEPHGVFFLIDNKSFYASVEATMRGLNPLKTILVVMSEQENTGGGLVLATSPLAKKHYGIKANVSRKRDLPDDPALMVVPPRMNLYIKRNLQINDIFRRFVADEDLWPYSIDESILDMTHSWRLFGKTPREVAVKIQKEVKNELGLYTTVGIGDTPVQAKLALDIYAKHTEDFVGEIHYDDVQETIWNIPEITDVWGIGERTAKRLRKLHIYSMRDLARANPYRIKQELGLIGMQLYATAWGIDRSQLKQPYKPKSKSIGNSQVLPRDYHDQTEIETVIKEITEQVCSRLRHHKSYASRFVLGVGFSYASSDVDGRSGFSTSIRIEPTHDSFAVSRELIRQFRNEWDDQLVRHLSVYSADLTDDSTMQLNLFQPSAEIEKHERTDKVIDEIRERFGFTALFYARSLNKGGTAIERSSLVGGHNGGNTYD